ncbi:putative serine/threonine-protein kinase putative protein kinase [Leptomonas seymouri]|uniref:non-specific serine/threonine protein kinase n=1 Tax=Leptomonas seymouri TaxID=5684 RepID=A0A0N1IHW8_LEPSE|nr:putative serine/threonine-protein kinase putative protein kinase [Leptomonas seymouri]|eukprot:KPI84195.1 putative serine/threonine-protein kinase putative protein kinase [Leptomonas seymouri]
MHSLLQRFCGSTTDAVATAGTAAPSPRQPHRSATDSDDSGYTSPGLVSVTAMSELFPPSFALRGHDVSATASRTLFNGEATNEAPERGATSALAETRSHADVSAHDDAVDDFLNNVIAGKTNVLRKQLAQQKLEAAAATAAAALAAPNAPGNSAAAGGGAADGQCAAGTGRQEATPASFAGGSGVRGGSANATTAPLSGDGKTLPSQPQFPPPSAAGATTSSGAPAPSPPPAHHRHKYVSSAARSLQDYELIAFLGSGTFAEVTLARNKITQEYFAVKKISKQRVKEGGCVERTFTERQLLANLHHPFLVRLYQAFQSQTHLYLVLDFAQGGDLFYVNAQQLWLRSMKRVLVKMRYPYYQSTSSTFALMAAGPDQASPTQAQSLRSSQGQAPSRLPSSPKAPAVSFTPAATTDAEASRRSRADGALRDEQQQQQTNEGAALAQTASPYVRPPLPPILSPTSAAAVAARRDHIEEAAGPTATPLNHVSASTGGAGGGNSSFTTTQTMTGATIAGGAANPPHPAPRRPSGIPKRYDNAVEEDESEFDLTDINNSMAGPYDNSFQTASTGPPRRRPPPDYRYYTTDAVDEFGPAAAAVPRVLPPVPGWVAVPPACAPAALSSDQYLPSQNLEADVTSAADTATPSRRPVCSAANISGDEDTPSASPSGSLAPAPLPLTTTTASLRTRYRLRRRGPSLGASSSSDDEGVERRSGGGDGLEGATRPGGATSLFTAVQRRNIQMARRRRSGGGATHSSSAAGASGETATAAVASASTLDVGGDAASPFGAKSADAAMVFGKPSAPSPTVVTARGEMTGEDSGAGRDAEAASAPSPAKSLPPSLERRLPQRSKQTPLGPSTPVGAVESSSTEGGNAAQRHRSRTEGSRETMKTKTKAQTGGGDGGEVTVNEARDAASAASRHETQKHQKRKRKVSRAATADNGSSTGGAGVSALSPPPAARANDAVSPAAAAASAAQGALVGDSGRGVAAGDYVTPTRSPAVVSPSQRAAANVAAAHVDLAAPFHQVGMESTKSLMRELPPSRFAPDDSHCLPLRMVAFYAIEVALVLQYLHGEGFLYRDLKPENILMRGDGHVMLTDFGVAKYRKGAAIAAAAGLTGVADAGNNNNNSSSSSVNAGAPAGPVRAGDTSAAATAAAGAAGTLDGKANSFTGTTQYMSPEMLRGLPHDSRTDWWSYGCLLFEWANGRKAFDGANQFSLFRSIVEEDVKVTPEDYRLTALEVHTRVAQLHYRAEELRMECEERLARHLRSGGTPAMKSGGTDHDGEIPASSTSPSAATHLGCTCYSQSAPASATSANTATAQNPRIASPVSQMLSATASFRNSSDVFSNPSCQLHPHRRLSERSFAGCPSVSYSNLNTNDNTKDNSSTTVTGVGTGVLQLSDSFASRHGLLTTPGKGEDLPHSRLGDSFNNSFACGSPTNASLRLTAAEDGSSAAHMSVASSATLREQQRRERQRQNKRRRARLSCLTIDPIVRDRYLDDAIYQMEEAQALLKDLTLRLLDRTVETRLSGDAVLEHPFFTCPYVVSQLYYRVYQQRALSRELRKSALTSALFRSCQSPTDFVGSMCDDRLPVSALSPLYPSEPSSPCTACVNGTPGSVHTRHASDGTAMRFPGSICGSFTAPSVFRRPDDWRRLFLERCIRAPYTPRLRARDDLRYFPAAVTATGLSAAVEQHRRLKEVKEHQKELLRASKATMLSSNNSLSANSSFVGRLSVAHGAGDSTVAMPTDEETAHQMQLALAGSAHRQRRGHSRVASRDEEQRLAAAASATGLVKPSTEPGATDGAATAANPAAGARTGLRAPAVDHTAHAGDAETSLRGTNGNHSESIASAGVARSAAVAALRAAHPLAAPTPSTSGDAVTSDDSSTTTTTSFASVVPAVADSTVVPALDAGDGATQPSEYKPLRGDIVHLGSTAHRATAAAAATASTTPTAVHSRTVTSTAADSGLQFSLASTTATDPSVLPAPSNDDYINSMVSAATITAGVVDSDSGAARTSSAQLLDRAATLPQSFVDAALTAAAAAQRKQQQHQQALTSSTSTSSMTLLLADAGTLRSTLADPLSPLSLRRASTAPIEGRVLTDDVRSMANAGSTAATGTASAVVVGADSGAPSVRVSAFDNASMAPAGVGDAGGVADAARHTYNDPEAVAELHGSAGVGLGIGVGDVGNGGSPIADDEVGGGGYYEQDAFAEEPHVEDGGAVGEISVAAMASGFHTRTNRDTMQSLETSSDDHPCPHYSTNPLSPDMEAFNTASLPSESGAASMAASNQSLQNIIEVEERGQHEVSPLVLVPARPVSSEDVLEIHSSSESDVRDSSCSDAVRDDESGDTRGTGEALPHGPDSVTADSLGIDSSRGSSLSPRARRPSLVNVPPTRRPSACDGPPAAPTAAHGAAASTPQHAAASTRHVLLDSSSEPAGEAPTRNPPLSLTLSQTEEEGARLPQHQPQQQRMQCAATSVSSAPFAAATAAVCTANAMLPSVSVTSVSPPTVPMAMPIGTTTTSGTAQASLSPEDGPTTTRVSHGGPPAGSTNVGKQYSGTIDDHDACADAPGDAEAAPPPRAAGVEERAPMAGPAWATAAVASTATPSTTGTAASAASVSGVPATTDVGTSAVVDDGANGGCSDVNDESEADERGYETSEGDVEQDAANTSDVDTTSSSSSTSHSTSSSASCDSAGEGSGVVDSEGTVDSDGHGAVFHVSVPQSVQPTPVAQQQLNWCDHVKDHVVHEGDLISTSLSSSLLDSVNLSISANDSTSSRSPSPLSTASSSGQQSGGYPTHRPHGHGREHRVSNRRALSPRDVKATTAALFADGESGQQSGDDIDAGRAVHAPSTGMPEHVTSAAAVSATALAGSPFKIPSGHASQRNDSVHTVTSVAGGAVVSAALNPSGGGPGIGGAWPSYESLGETSYLGDTLSPESRGRADFFGPLTTLSGVAYNVDEEMSGSSVVSTPLPVPEGLPAALQALTAKNSMGVGQGEVSSRNPSARDGLPVAGRGAKTVWMQQQRKRINRELQLQHHGPAHEQQQLFSPVIRSPPPVGAASAGSSGFGSRGDHDEFLGFTFVDQGAGLMMQGAGRRGSEDGFDPFQSATDVNSSPHGQSSGSTNYNMSRSRLGGRGGRGQELASPTAGHPPVPRYPPAPNASSSLPASATRHGGPYAHLSSGGVGGGDHFQNFSFTSPQIMQQYLASSSNAGGAADGAGVGGGRPPYGRRPRR